VLIKIINGKISYIIYGVFKKVNKSGFRGLPSISLKKFTSSKIFKINIREKKIKETNNIIFKKDCMINF
tara:strand:- start:286 stop:492 length:207 start_codon:yes stop_codon:yes gene_type:complete